jgi:hypothetical protein
MHRNRLAVPIFLLACTTACPKHIDFGPEGQIQDARTLLKRLASAEAQVFSVKGEAKLKVRSPQSNGAVTLFVAVSRPSLIHVESLDFFGRPQAVLASDGQHFELADAAAGKFYEGPASAQNVSRLLPILLPPAEMVALMLGQAPRVPAEDAQLQLDEQAGQYRLTLQVGKATQTLWIEPRIDRVVKSQVRGVDAYDASFQDIQETGAVTFPRSLSLEAAASSTSLELRYTDYTLNESPDLSLFQLEPTPGAVVIQVDANGQPVQSSDGGIR